MAAGTWCNSSPSLLGFDQRGEMGESQGPAEIALFGHLSILMSIYDKLSLLLLRPDIIISVDAHFTDSIDDVLRI
jgi:hypothetical protein